MPEGKKFDFISILKNPTLHACLIGACGGMAPELVKMVQPLLKDDMPSAGQALALAILAFLGFLTVVIYKETTLHKAFLLGIGAPALIGSLVGQASTAMSYLDLKIDLFPAAYAQPADSAKFVRLIFKENQSPHKLNTLLIQADGLTLKYSNRGDTILVHAPRGTQALKLSLSGSDKDLELPLSSADSLGNFYLRISGNKFWKDFFQTIGNAKSPDYNIERVTAKK